MPFRMLGGSLVGGRTRRLVGALAATLLAACTVLALAPAAGAEKTLGSTLEDSYDTTFGGITGITVYQEAAPSESLTAPGPGTITSWSVRSGDSGAEYELRILRPAAGGELTAVSTSALLTRSPTAKTKCGTFPVSLPVKTGDLIALYVVKGLGAPYHENAVRTNSTTSVTPSPTAPPRNLNSNRSTAAARSCCCQPRSTAANP